VGKDKSAFKLQFYFFYLKDILIILLYFQKRRKNILTFGDEYLGITGYYVKFTF